MLRRFASICIAWLVIAPAAVLAEPSLSAERSRLAGLVRSDPEAGQLYGDLHQAAEGTLHDRPYPIKTIVSEGRLGSDPERIRTYESLPDMDKIDALHAAWLITNDQKYLAKLHEFLLSWGSTNVSEGNPINDMKVEAAVTAYGDTRSLFSAEERSVIDGWLRTMGHALIDNIGKKANSSNTNWQSHRLKMIGFAAFILDDDALKRYTIEGYRRQVDENLRPDGSTLDFEIRDALHYQCYDLEPLLTLAIAADRAGVDLYSYQSPTGASLAKSVAFLVPYCEGTKAHPEFLNSKDDFDRKRAASGDNMYKAGHPFNPHMGLHSLELAAYFDRSLVPLVCKLADPNCKRYPTWRIVLNDATRKD